MIIYGQTPRSRRHEFRPVWVISALNLLFWGWLWVDVARHLEPFVDRRARFEEVVPVYKFDGLAIPTASDHAMLSLKAMRVIQQPTYMAVVRIANRLSGGSWDMRWGSLSVGSWVLVATMLISYFQWGLTGWLIARFLRWYAPSDEAVPRSSGTHNVV